MQSELDRELAKLGSGGHLCVLYEDPTEQMAAGAAFLKDGLNQGERAVYIAADADTADAIAALTAAGVDVARERERGALQFLTTRDSYLRGGRFDPDAMIKSWRRMIEEALADGFTGFRGIGEMTWILESGTGFDHIIAYEAKLNALFSGARSAALCQFDRRRFPPALLIDILRTHPVAVVDGHACHNPYYEPPALILGKTVGIERLNWMLGSVREIDRTAHILQANTERLQWLSREWVTAQENERRHTARELHDEVGQALSAVKVNLQAVERLKEADQVTARLEDSIGIVDHAIEQVRAIAQDLRPAILDDLGLVAALRWLARNCAGRWGVRITCVADPPDMRLPSEIETTCFRVTQEALTNVGRHAGATRVRVELRRRHAEVELRIIDDGVGFDVSAAQERAVRGKSFGLLGMEERVRLVGGRFRIDADAQKGTVVCAQFPLPRVSG